MQDLTIKVIHTATPLSTVTPAPSAAPPLSRGPRARLHVFYRAAPQPVAPRPRLICSRALRRRRRHPRSAESSDIACAARRAVARSLLARSPPPPRASAPPAWMRRGWCGRRPSDGFPGTRHGRKPMGTLNATAAGCADTRGCRGHRHHGRCSRAARRQFARLDVRHFSCVGTCAPSRFT